MRVLLWSELFWPYVGGAELFAAGHMPALRDRGHEFLVVTSHDSLDLPNPAWFEGIPVRDANDGAEGDVLLEVRIAARLVKPYEWVEEGKSYREFLVPTALLNLRGRVRRLE